MKSNSSHLLIVKMVFYLLKTAVEDLNFFSIRNSLSGKEINPLERNI